MNSEKKKTIPLTTFKRQSHYLLFIRTDCGIIKIRIFIFRYRLVISKSSKKFKLLKSLRVKFKNEFY